MSSQAREARRRGVATILSDYREEASPVSVHDLDGAPYRSILAQCHTVSAYAIGQLGQLESTGLDGALEGAVGTRESGELDGDALCATKFRGAFTVDTIEPRICGASDTAGVGENQVDDVARLQASVRCDSARMPFPSIPEGCMQSHASSTPCSSGSCARK